MALYKVPQDVEAEDKLIGPFSFRQFIYLIVAALGIAAAVGLWQLFPGLIVIPLPVIALFLVLALPLRKDQPMETYLTAVIRFFLKPRRRLWQPEGSIGLVTIVAPRTQEMSLTKSVGGAAAAAQLGYLAQVVDTQGWASRGVTTPTASMNDIAYAEAQQAEDILDENADVARTFDAMIGQSSASYKQSVVNQFRQQASQTTGAPAPQVQPAPATTLAPDEITVAAQPATEDSSDVDFNPYPNSMHQRVLRPIGDTPEPVIAAPQPVAPPKPAPQAQKVEPAPSPEPVSPDIMRLANNNDLSISALANEAHRLKDRDNEEVVISLR